MALTGDFIGFSFNGKHSSELGIVRTSDGSRYNEGLLPSFNDNTIAVPGGDGTYYFGSYYNRKDISVSFATDELTEVQFRELRKWLGDKGIHDLIFDEAPYKAYSAKIAAVPNFSYICFDKYQGEAENQERVYKGEGVIQFVCYYPFARSVHKYLDDYTDENMVEWVAASGMVRSNQLNGLDQVGNSIPPSQMNDTIFLYNPGDLEADFMLYCESPAQGVTPYWNSYNSIRLQSKFRGAPNEDFIGYMNISTDIGYGTKFRINSKANLIEEIDEHNQPTGRLLNKYITKGEFFKMPVGLINQSFPNSCPLWIQCNYPNVIKSIEYNYLYF